MVKPLNSSMFQNQPDSSYNNPNLAPKQFTSVHSLDYKLWTALMDISYHKRRPNIDIFSNSVNFPIDKSEDRKQINLKNPTCSTETNWSLTEKICGIFSIWLCTRCIPSKGANMLKKLFYKTITIYYICIHK